MAISAIPLHHPLHVLKPESMLRFIRLCGLNPAMLHPDRILFGVLYFHPDQVLLSGYGQSDPACHTAVCYLAAGPDRIFQRIFKDGVDIRKCHERKVREQDIRIKLDLRGITAKLCLAQDRPQSR